MSNALQDLRRRRAVVGRRLSVARHEASIAAAEHWAINDITRRRAEAPRDRAAEQTQEYLRDTARYGVARQNDEDAQNRLADLETDAERLDALIDELERGG